MNSSKYRRTINKHVFDRKRFWTDILILMLKYDDSSLNINVFQVVTGKVLASIEFNLFPTLNCRLEVLLWSSNLKQSKHELERCPSLLLRKPVRLIIYLWIYFGSYRNDWKWKVPSHKSWKVCSYLTEFQVRKSEFRSSD